MENESYNTFSLRDILLVLFKHKASILVLSLSILLTVSLGVSLWPETYEAKASILVKLGKENVSLPNMGTSNQQQLVSTGLKKEDINSEVRLLENRFIIEKVVKELQPFLLRKKRAEPETRFQLLQFELKRMLSALSEDGNETLYNTNLKKRLSDYDSLVVRVQKNLSVQQVKDSNVIEVAFKWSDPAIATKVLDTLINFYLAHHLEAYKTSERYDFFQKQVGVIAGNLKDSEDDLQFLQESEGIVSYGEQKSFLLERVTTLKATLKNTQTELMETKAKIAEIKQKLGTESETIQLSNEVQRNPIIDSLKKNLLELKLEREKNLAHYLDNDRFINSIDEEIKKVNNELASEQERVVGTTTSGINAVYKEIQRDLINEDIRLKSLTAKETMLKQHINVYQEELEKLNSFDTDLKRLARQIQINEKNYLLYRDKLEEARILDIMDSKGMVNIRVIDPAAANFIPIQPNKLLIIGTGLALSLIFGLGLAFMLEYFDHSIKTTDDVNKYLDLPVLASINEG